jgi:hypothetical protein
MVDGVLKTGYDAINFRQKSLGEDSNPHNNPGGGKEDSWKWKNKLINGPKSQREFGPFIH